MRGSLVIPTLNEGSSVGHVVSLFRTAAQQANRELFPREPLDWEILVVDGGSTDDTVSVAQAAGARVIPEPRPGYGQAYCTGFAASTGTVVATADGDATYPVGEIPTLVRRLLDRNLDFITGDRLTHLDRRSMTTEHRIGNRLLNLFLHVAYHSHLRRAGTQLVDSQSGLWVFRREVLDRLRLTQTGMAFSEEIKLEAILRGCRFEEVPIHYAERWGAPKLSSWRDGQRNLEFLLSKRLALARELRHANGRTRGDRMPNAGP